MIQIIQKIKCYLLKIFKMKLISVLIKYLIGLYKCVFSAAVVHSVFAPTGPPDAPNSPRVHEVTASTARLSWHEPKDNGSPILGYWVERKEVNSTHWTRVNRVLLSSLEVKVIGLMEGLTYIFRVCAENLAGPGPFSEPSDRTITMDAISKSTVRPGLKTQSLVKLGIKPNLFSMPLPQVPPGPPTPWIVDTGKDSVIVAWKPPLYNGGGDILGYHVEKVLNIKQYVSKR